MKLYEQHHDLSMLISYVDQYLHHFENSKEVATIKNMILKKSVDQFGDIHYGLFDATGKIVSYQYLDKQDQFYVSSMPITRKEYQKQGWMTYIMDYAVLKDKLTVAGDTRQTPEAIKLWRALTRNARYRVFIYNKKTGEKNLFKSTGRKPWQGETEDTFLITEHSQELVENQEKWFVRMKRIRSRPLTEDSFYGPETSSALFWNP